MSRDRANGLFLGLCVGDAAGGVLELPLRESVDAGTVDWALTFPGGGAHRLGRGQVTDEAELAIALAHALGNYAPPVFPADYVATSYAQWLDSKPFTVGRQCRKPLLAAKETLSDAYSIVSSPSRAMTAVAAKTNAASQTNGALARCLPLAIWGRTLTDDELACCAEDDCRFTHPHENCRAASAVMCITLKHLICSPGNADVAIKAAQEYAQRCAPSDVRGWVDEALVGHSCPSVSRTGSSEWVRWPLMYSLRHLRQRSSFEGALHDVLSRGGATSANAAVVGAVMGALHGSEAIPAAFKGPVLARGPKAPGNPRHPRPAWLATELLPMLTQQLLHATDSIGLGTPEKTGSR